MTTQPTWIPDQDTINAVALHFDIACQLALSPFFDEDSLNLGYTGTLMMDGDLEEVNLADEKVLSNVLLLFRRIWATAEPAGFLRINNVLYRSATKRATQEAVSLFRQTFDKAVSKWEGFQDDYGITPADMIDLMLNTKYFHSSSTSHVGRFTSADLQTFRSRIGPRRLEYLFENRVFMIGLDAYQHGLMGASALRYWHILTGLTPQVTVTRFASQYLIQTPSDPEVTRHSRGFTPNNIETPHECMQRLMARQKYQPLSDILERIIELSNKGVDLLNDNTIEQIIVELGFELRSNGINLDPKTIRYGGCMADPDTRRVLSYQIHDRIVVLNHDAPYVLNRMLREVRALCHIQRNRIATKQTELDKIIRQWDKLWGLEKGPSLI